MLDMPADTEIEALRIAWLIDSRSQGLRIAAYLDDTVPLRVPEGFPWAPVPDSVKAEHSAPASLKHTVTSPASTPIWFPPTPPTPPAPASPATYDDPWVDES